MKTLFLYLIAILSIFHHQTLLYENQKILFFFLENLLPSLFILCVLVQMIPLPHFSGADRFFIKVFGFDTSTFLLIIKVILLGLPSGSYLVNTLVKSKQCTQKQAARIITCCAIPSISFMLMSLASLTSQIVSLSVFLIHLTSLLILLFLTRKNTITLKHIPSPLSLSSSILFALKSMAMILSYLFLSITLKTLFVLYFPFLEEITHLLSEFSSAVLYFRHHEHVMIFLLICIGFGGFASHLQVMNGCDEITMSYSHYLFFQITHMLLNLMIYFIFSFIF